MTDPFLILLAVMVGIWGACAGSFLNVCIYRIPRDESVVTPRSHCPACGRLIPWYLNLPVLSWLLLAGRCRFCRARITPRYLLVELLTAALFLVLLFQQREFPQLLGMQQYADWRLVPIYMLFAGGLILGTFVDLEHMIIPDSVSIGGIVAGVALSALVPSMHGVDTWLAGLLRGALGAAVGFALLWLIAIVGEKVFRKEAMGFGDVKLMGAIGAFLGWQAVLFTMVGASLFGSVVGITLIALRRTKMQQQIPFGPYLALAAMLWVFWGPLLLKSYFTMMRLI